MTLLGTPVLPAVEFGQVPLWRQIMRGFSQCAFQANELTGLVFILAVAVYDLRFAAFYVIGVVVGTIVAKLLRGIGDLLDLGLYGFNSGLVGLGIATFFVPSGALWIVVPIMAAVVAAVAVLFSKVLPVPFLAAPFIVSLWILYAIGPTIGLDHAPFAPFTDTEVLWVSSALTAAGGALFSNFWLSGVIFLVGIAISNSRHALIAFAAVFIAHWIAFQGQVDPGPINAGLIGFNAILCAIAVYSLLGEDLRLTLLGAIGSTMLIRVFNEIGLLPLAAGFVLMFWIIVALDKLGQRFREAPAPAEA
jgi:urea transporter